MKEKFGFKGLKFGSYNTKYKIAREINITGLIMQLVFNLIHYSISLITLCQSGLINSNGDARFLNVFTLIITLSSCNICEKVEDMYRIKI